MIASATIHQSSMDMEASTDEGAHREIPRPSQAAAKAYTSAGLTRVRCASLCSASTPDEFIGAALRSNSNLSEGAEESRGVAAVFVVTGIDHDQALRLMSSSEKSARSFRA